MTQEVVIDLKNVSKCFKQYNHPVDRLKEIVWPANTKATEFWALKGINLKLYQGETLGIVGRNGSGKSTLLQVIVGTLTPTTGEVNVNGRISALLELGSGFNPEFTGRQNVFFNGRILGLQKEEIEEKFDAIVSFADIGSFIDQPVKTYSSGMFVRLAFAVAINADPDILVVDEALSVGDEAFQRKCYSKLKSFQDAGKTILFVSHSATSVVEMCNWAILVDSGEILLAGAPKLVVAKYHKLLYSPADKVVQLREEIRNFNGPITSIATAAATETGLKLPELGQKRNDPFYDPNLIPKSTIQYIPRGAEIVNPSITTLEGKRVNHLIRGQEYIYSYRIDFTESAHGVRCGMLIKTISGFELGGAASHTIFQPIDYIPAGTSLNVEFKFLCSLLPGAYFLNNGVLGLVNNEEVYLHRCIDAMMFRVQPEDDLLGTCIVDFQVESNTSVVQSSPRVTA
ncbi:MAG: Vitamin B12 import ATP-binding protein BtuD [Chroococcopsis gigantea SAG 12.99]|jgi:lipopolysaccharide transport system ATP-binding protein|nr:ABC transporter ATP-binding protein [Chlorogloea purpurea SAG 13.99]MDV3000253.1 Vitamin B12 import ATP-binding protein BtuD [Chroococcopsis gigantea SAG 12.99]